MSDSKRFASYGRPYGELVEDSPLLHAWRVIRERWWVVAAAVVTCTAAALVFALASDNEYEASSELLFRDPGLSVAVAGTTLFEASSDPQRDAATNAELVRSTEVAQLVVDDLGLDISADDLLDAVNIDAQENTDLVDITARSLEPELAASIADSFAESYVDFRRESDQEKVRQGRRLIDSRLENLPSGATDERDELEQARRTLALLESVQTGNAEVVETASIPSDPVSPTPRRDAALGFVFGLVLGIGLAFFLDLLDRRLKTVDEFERRYRVRSLAAIPQATFGRSLDDATVAEPYRILRSTIDYRSAWKPIKVLLITSAVPGEGKTTVAANLARSMAAGRQRVALVEADMRRPSLTSHFDRPRMDVGLSTALAREMPAERVVSPTGIPNLALIAAGPPPPNPSELLRGERMGELLTELSEEVDIVIIDTPPLLPVADTQTLLGIEAIDACVVVGRTFWTMRQDAERARTILQQHGTEPIGLVVCGTRERPSGYSEYLAPAAQPD